MNGRVRQYVTEADALCPLSLFLECARVFTDFVKSQML
jgi:hypothetical protein